MLLVVTQHGVWLAPDDPMSAKIHVRISAISSMSLIAVLNQANFNQQAYESAQSIVQSAATGVVEESGDSASAAQDSDSEPVPDLGVDICQKAQKCHHHKAKKSKSKKSK